MFDPRLLKVEPFVPHPYAALKGVFPEGALPEAGYAQLINKYQQVGDVIVSRIVHESDGLRVTGLMAEPAQIQPKSHPVTIFNRGGNREFGKLTVANVLRVMVPLAREGHVVLASNYRGNDGGEGREEFGGADVNDVLNLLALARAHPAHDGRNAFMIGHSRGGMMTYLALKSGAEVRAAVAIAAPSDLAASVAERPEMEARVYGPLIPGENRHAAYAARSAVCWPERLRMPLLLLHGDADDRVDASHSVKLAAALEAIGAPYELVMYPQGNHALLRHWDDVLIRITQWFDSHRA